MPHIPKLDVIPISALGEKFYKAVINRLPSRDSCHPFFESFLLGIHPLVPVCHIPTLIQTHSECWTRLSPNYSVETLALVLAVLYTGAANSNPVNVTACSALLGLYEEIFEAIDFASYLARDTRASIHLLQACIIMNMFKASQLSPFSAYGFLPQVIRFAQSLRLHVDQKKGDLVEQEVKRRAWWHLVFLDMESTIATGLPPIIHRGTFTTQLPSLYDIDLAALRDSILPGTKDISPMMVSIQGHFQWAQKMQMWFENLPSQEEVLDFKNSIEKLLNLVPTDSTPLERWANIYLKIQIDRAYCMLGLRFWQLDQYKGTGCESEVVKLVPFSLPTSITNNNLEQHALSYHIISHSQHLHPILSSHGSFLDSFNHSTHSLSSSCISALVKI